MFSSGQTCATCSPGEFAVVRLVWVAAGVSRVPCIAYMVSGSGCDEHGPSLNPYISLRCGRSFRWPGKLIAARHFPRRPRFFATFKALRSSVISFHWRVLSRRLHLPVHPAPQRGGLSSSRSTSSGITTPNIHYPHGNRRHLGLWWLVLVC